jgi:hypothetical protein
LELAFWKSLLNSSEDLLYQFVGRNRSLAAQRGICFRQSREQATTLQGKTREDLKMERTALKEWAVLVDAMARGDIIAMVRKGGIREQRAGFSVRHDRFVLYPTFFHEKVGELAPRFRESLEEAHGMRPDEGTVRIAHVADVVGLWTVTELESLRAIDNEHGLAWSPSSRAFTTVTTRWYRLSRCVFRR